MENYNLQKEELINNVNAIIDTNCPLVSNLSSVVYLIKETFKNASWAGLYINHDNVLYVGPYQGSIACTIIPFNKGVCGKSAYQKETIIVDDVNKFEGHIACSSTTKSEIVVPIIKDDIVYGVIDLDSEIYSGFNQIDANILKEVADILANLFYENSKSK